MKTLRQQLAEAQAEVARLRNIVRTPREPLRGTLGGVVQNLREAQGLKLRELAVKSGVAAGLLSRLERVPDANPTFNNLVKIAKALSTPVSVIISKWESENNQADRP